MVVLASDGVIEAKNSADTLFSFDRLERVIAAGPTNSAQAMIDHLRDEVDRFVDRTEPHDNLTIAVVHVPSAAQLHAAAN